MQLKLPKALRWIARNPNEDAMGVGLLTPEEADNMKRHIESI